MTNVGMIFYLLLIKNNMIYIKTSSDIDAIRKSNKLVAHVLSQIRKEAKPGVTTKYLDELAENLALQNNALPGFKGYKGFPASICASVNNEVVHGIPNNTPLANGDVLSVDFGILLDGWYGDAAITVPIGKISKPARKLITVTEECLYRGINSIKIGGRVKDISTAIQSHAELNGFNVIRDYVGHGIGRELHEAPSIPNYVTNHNNYKLIPGMVIAIEPMVVQYDYNTISKGWTVLTKDGGLAAHFEHTVTITRNGVKILSRGE